MSEPQIAGIPLSQKTETLNFKDCTLSKLDKIFGLQEVTESQILEEWLTASSEISEFERQTLLNLRKKLKRNVHDWNEAELAQYFIGPLLTLVDYTTDRFNLFAERPFSGIVQGIEMKGRPDAVIATGIREPEKPFFCFQEYKKELDPEGDHAAQALAAMLVAQEINENKHPIYGCYVKGRDWFFMALHGKYYAISEPYIASRDDDIFYIFRILKELKLVILEITDGLFVRL
jgi:hypothetical protein